MDIWLVQALQAVGLGGVLVLLLAFGLLRTNREVKEKDEASAIHVAQIVEMYETAMEKQVALAREAGAAKDNIIAGKDKELEYWRGTAIRLLEVGEKMVDTNG